MVPPEYNLSIYQPQFFKPKPDTQYFSRHCGGFFEKLPLSVKLVLRYILHFTLYYLAFCNDPMLLFKVILK